MQKKLMIQVVLEDLSEPLRQINKVCDENGFEFFYAVVGPMPDPLSVGCPSNSELTLLDASKLSTLFQKYLRGYGMDHLHTELSDTDRLQGDPC